MIRDVIPDPDLDFLPIPDPGSRVKKISGSWIPDPDPQYCPVSNRKRTVDLHSVFQKLAKHF